MYKHEENCEGNIFTITFNDPIFVDGVYVLKVEDNGVVSSARVVKYWRDPDSYRERKSAANVAFRSAVAFKYAY